MQRAGGGTGMDTIRIARLPKLLIMEVVRPKDEEA